MASLFGFESAMGIFSLREPFLPIRFESPRVGGASSGAIGRPPLSHLPQKIMIGKGLPADGHIAESCDPFGKGWVRAEHPGKDLTSAQWCDDE